MLHRTKRPHKGRTFAIETIETFLNRNTSQYTQTTNGLLSQWACNRVNPAKELINLLGF